jgi:hypothetical protein
MYFFLVPFVVPIFIIDFAKLWIIMFAFGFEENTANFLQVIKQSLGVALFGAITSYP